MLPSVFHLGDGVNGPAFERPLAAPAFAEPVASPKARSPSRPPAPTAQNMWLKLTYTPLSSSLSAYSAVMMVARFQDARSARP
jgi:hypothetical protein